MGIAQGYPKPKRRIILKCEMYELYEAPKEVPPKNFEEFYEKFKKTSAMKQIPENEIKQMDCMLCTTDKVDVYR